MHSLDIDTQRTRKRCAHRHRKSVRFRTRAHREYRLAVARTDTTAYTDITEYLRRFPAFQSRNALIAAQSALTVLDVVQLPVMLSMGRARNHPGDTADRRRIAGGERPLDRLVDIAFALATVRMLLSIPCTLAALSGPQ